MDGNDRRRKAGKALGVGTSIYAIGFVILWCCIAASMGAWFMLIFGIPMLIFMIVRLVMILRKEKEVPQDRWQNAASGPDVPLGGKSSEKNGFCPYCGRALEGDFAFCPHCGRRQA